MSFAHTEQQIRDRTKTVTRRMGWKFLEPGDELWAVRTVRGIIKGEKVERICRIRVLKVRRERLCFITPTDVRKEGFPDLTVTRFVQMFCREMGCEPLDHITRIEFEYTEELA